METLNQSLFLMFNAPAHASGLAVALALFFGEYLIFLLPLNQLAAWVFKRPQRSVWLGSLLAIITALLLNQAVGLLWYHPRPFAIGLGHTLIQHVADSSFPSDHLTVIWAAAVYLLLHPSTRKWGMLWLLAGIPAAWARIYLGVHYPLDMAGALMSGALAAFAVNAVAMGKLNQCAEKIYRTVLAYPVRQGWLPE